MKQLIVICCFVALAYSKSFGLNPELVGHDDYHLNSNLNPGIHCINMWDDGCANGQLPGAGDDDYYLDGGFNPGKRSLIEFLKKYHKTKPTL